MKNLSNVLKQIVIGRDFSFFDKFIYFISRKKSSGWVFGNYLRNFSYGYSKGTSDVPVVTIGCFPRSGSTLLGAMLQAHPDICASQVEINLFQDIKTIDQKNEMNILSGFSASKEEIEVVKNKRNLTEAADYLLKNYMKKNNAKKVLLKQPKHIFFIRKIFKHFPEAKFIHIIRDGKDCSMSQRYYLLPKGRREWPYDWCCRQWNVAVNRGKEYRKDKNYFEIKYEDLVAAPIENLNSIFDFLGLSRVGEEVIEKYYKEFDKSKRPDHIQVGNPLTKKNVNKWLDKMSEKDMDIFDKICGDNYRELGYK